MRPSHFTKKPHKAIAARRIFTTLVVKILRAADGNGDMSHISRALKLAVKAVETPEIESTIHHMVSKRGWAQCEATVMDFLCNRDVPKMKSCESVILTLAKLVHERCIPRKLALDVLQMVVAFVEQKEGFNTTPVRHSSVFDIMTPYEKKQDTVVGQWCTVLDILEKIRADTSAADGAEAVDTLVGRLAVVIDKLKENELEDLEKGLRLGPKQGPYSFPDAQFRSAASKRRGKLQLAKFLDEADFIIKNKSMKTKEFYSIENWGLPEQRGVFVNLACSVSSADVVEKTAKERFDSVLKIIPSLPKEDIAVLLCDSNRKESSGMHEPTILLIKQTIESAKLSSEEKSLREQIQKLEAATVVKTENVQVRYPGPFGSGFQEVERFMASEQTVRVVTGFNSVVVARKALRGFQNMLPAGMEAEAAGYGRNSFIRLRKPFAQERELWLKYKKDLTELGKARKQLSAVLKKLTPRTVASQNPAKRLKTEHEGPSVGGAGGLNPRHHSVAKKEGDIL